MINLTQILSCANSFHPALRYNQKSPPVVVWNLLESCNLNCFFCYYDAKKEPKGNGVDYDLVRSIAGQIKEAKIRYLLISGGEPLLYPRISTLVKSLSSSCRIGLSTNGTLIDKKSAISLKSSGLDYIGISLDGPQDIHNNLRNSSYAFSQALRGIQYAKEAGFNTGIRLTLNSYNYKSIRDIFCIAQDLRVDRLCFYHLVYSGRGSIAPYDLTREQRLAVLNSIIKLADGWIKRRISTQVLTVDNFSDAAILLNYIQKKKNARYAKALELLTQQGGCPAGKRILSIDHKGYLHPCQFWNTYRLADLRKERLLNFLNHGAFFPGWREKLKGKCGVCSYKEICGGCRMRAFGRYKDYWQEDPSCVFKDGS